jgi:hypothetical protein
MSKNSWPPVCPKCEGNDTTLRYDTVGSHEQLRCTCGRCKYGWFVSPRDMPEPAASPSTIEGDGDEKGKEQEIQAAAHLCGGAIREGTGDFCSGVCRGNPQQRFGVSQLIDQIEIANTLQKRIDKGVPGVVRGFDHGGIYIRCNVDPLTLPLAGRTIGSRVRVLLEGE